MYQTVRYEIKEGHDMYRYCQVCAASWAWLMEACGFIRV